MTRLRLPAATTRARVVNRLIVRPFGCGLAKRRINFEDFKLPLGTLRDWEQHRREPDTGSKLYLSMIEADPEAVKKILAKV